MGARTIVFAEGRGLPMRGDDIDTDRIMPARFLRAVTFEGLERHLFEDERAGSAAAAQAHGVHPFDNPHYRGASVLVVNRNFGCGSSREHAPQALYRLGIRAVVGESFSEIFFGNAVLIGMPCVTASPDDVHEIMERVEERPETVVRVDLPSDSCEIDGVTYDIRLPGNVRDAFITGAWDTTGLLLDGYADVDAVAARLPYVGGF
ncbi:MAG: 3-isopropylmalate dehydratase small subunit [Acidobacteria bacterium]|nr:3-isopropylmalate dehydratase small subunit [Acidobacteriota bacterium]